MRLKFMYRFGSELTDLEFFPFIKRRGESATKILQWTLTAFRNAGELNGQSNGNEFR